jgi:hypothetical protein
MHLVTFTRQRPRNLTRVVGHATVTRKILGRDDVNLRHL